MPNAHPTYSWLLKNPICFIALGFGSGLIRPAPGTWGTLIALPLAWLLLQLNLSIPHNLLIVGTLFAIGLPICSIAEQKIGISDYSGIVWDEIVAMLFILIWLPESWLYWCGAFILFRLLDISKPWPIRWLDKRVHHGLGIMLDDIIAALFSLIILWLFKISFHW